MSRAAPAWLASLDAAPPLCTVPPTSGPPPARRPASPRGRAAARAGRLASWYRDMEAAGLETRGCAPICVAVEVACRSPRDARVAGTPPQDSAWPQSFKDWSSRTSDDPASSAACSVSLASPTTLSPSLDSSDPDLCSNPSPPPTAVLVHSEAGTLDDEMERLESLEDASLLAPPARAADDDPLAMALQRLPLRGSLEVSAEARARETPAASPAESQSSLESPPKTALIVGTHRHFVNLGGC